MAVFKFLREVLDVIYVCQIACASMCKIIAGDLRKLFEHIVGAQFGNVEFTTDVAELAILHEQVP